MVRHINPDAFSLDIYSSGFFQIKFFIYLLKTSSPSRDIACSRPPTTPRELPGTAMCHWEPHCFHGSHAASMGGRPAVSSLGLHSAVEAVGPSPCPCLCLLRVWGAGPSWGTAAHWPSSLSPSPLRASPACATTPCVVMTH